MLRIHEPWHLDVSIRAREFPAIALGIIHGPDLPNWQRRHLLLELSEPFTCEDETVSQITCAPRYQGDPMFLAMHLSCTVGICRVKPGYVYKLSSRISPDEVDYFAIGDIRAVNRLNNLADSVGQAARRVLRRPDPRRNYED